MAAPASREVSERLRHNLSPVKHQNRRADIMLLKKEKRNGDKKIRKQTDSRRNILIFCFGANRNTENMSQSWNWGSKWNSNILKMINVVYEINVNIMIGLNGSGMLEKMDMALSNFGVTLISKYQA